MEWWPPSSGGTISFPSMGIATKESDGLSRVVLDADTRDDKGIGPCRSWAQIPGFPTAVHEIVRCCSRPRDFRVTLMTPWLLTLLNRSCFYPTLRRCAFSASETPRRLLFLLEPYTALK